MYGKSTQGLAVVDVQQILTPLTYSVNDETYTTLIRLAWRRKELCECSTNGSYYKLMPRANDSHYKLMYETLTPYRSMLFMAANTS